MNIDDIHLRDLVIAAYIIGIITPIIGSVLIWVINRYLKQQDVRTKRTEDFIEIANETLAELKVITQVHEGEIERIKDDIRATFMIKYTKGQ
jgi:hypothetical protein